jgi:hypothetical protein
MVFEKVDMSVVGKELEEAANSAVLWDNYAADLVAA